MDRHDRSSQEDNQAVPSMPEGKRGYRAPVLTEYGRVDELVDAGVVGSAPSIMATGG